MQIVDKRQLVPAKAGQRQPCCNCHIAFGRRTPLLDFFGQHGQCQQVVIVGLRFVALDGLPPAAAIVKLAAVFQHILPGVRFVGVGRDTGWEGAVPSLDGLIAMVDANDHVVSSLSWL